MNLQPIDLLASLTSDSSDLIDFWTDSQMDYDWMQFLLKWQLQFTNSLASMY